MPTPQPSARELLREFTQLSNPIEAIKLVHAPHQLEEIKGYVNTLCEIFQVRDVDQTALYTKLKDPYGTLYRTYVTLSLAAKTDPAVLRVTLNDEETAELLPEIQNRLALLRKTLTATHVETREVKWPYVVFD